MIKVHIRRKVSPQKRDKLQVLINKLRALTMGQPGYIAGETLKRVDTPGESLVVSKWQSTEYWKQWVESTQRAEISFWGKRLTTKYMNMIKTVFKSSSFARCLCYVSLQNARVLACTLCF